MIQADANIWIIQDKYTEFINFIMHYFLEKIHRSYCIFKNGIYKKVQKYQYKMLERFPSILQICKQVDRYYKQENVKLIG